jgi:glycosyltransferase involved in cell wall biosynthesis
VDDGVTGWRVPSGDVHALSERMISALEADTSRMRVAARRAAEVRFSADRFAHEVAGVLRRVGAG